MEKIGLSILQPHMSRQRWLWLSSTLACVANPHRRSYGQEISSAQVGWAHSSMPSSVVRWLCLKSLRFLEASVW